MKSMKDDEFDLVWGVGNIARLIGRTPRQTFHYVRNGHLPAKKIGRRWVAERSALVRFFRMDSNE
ncbi:helix-turn-helix domain-containing protein [Acuticoccus sp. M5D2P5]|nr:helix-turn-helix domain-containing protein [Acuticoccus kalidii]MCF3935266.1 helix-turn-helix domain-containing protein [Acuticoccus kalidii]